jgi:phage/plasmid-like protein (TIGR03299 family)
MAHEIENNKAFYTVKPAWHGLGEVLSAAPSATEAWRMAYPHTLIETPVSWSIQDDAGTLHHEKAQGFKAIVRDDGRVLGIHSDAYGLVQPGEVFKRFEPLIDSGLVELEAGGSLYEGRRMWALAKVRGADAEILPGDTVKGYVLFQESWDGSTQSGMGLTNVRVVCANTLAAAQGDVSYRTRHTRHVNARLDSYRDQIAGVLQGFQKSVENMRALAARKVTRQAQEVYVREVIAGPESLAVGAELSTKLENKVQNVITLLDTQKGLEFVPAIRGTAWQAYNAVTEYLTHEHGRTVDSRLANQWFGAGVAQNRAALERALTM